MDSNNVSPEYDRDQLLSILKSLKDKVNIAFKNPLAYRNWILNHARSLDEADFKLAEFPSLDNRRKREKISSKFPTKAKRIKITKSCEEPSSVERMLTEAESAELDDIIWPTLMAGNQDTILYFISKSSKKEHLLRKYSEAKKLWNCNLCNRYELTDMLSGFIECTDCNLWCHQKCGGVLDVDINTAWSCSTCK